MYREKSPAELLVCLLQDKRKRGKDNKDMEELYCHVGTTQQSVHIEHQGQGDNVESGEQQDTERNNTLCAVLVCDSLVQRINFTHARISPTGL